jgi:protein-S-isoprenylcysteine O-methyltransferase Ste14
MLFLILENQLHLSSWLALLTSAISLSIIGFVLKRKRRRKRNKRWQRILRRSKTAMNETLFYVLMTLAALAILYLLFIIWAVLPLGWAIAAMFVIAAVIVALVW